jgi:hypothetical protein
VGLGEALDGGLAAVIGAVVDDPELIRPALSGQLLDG